ncbi:MAG: hypothetical protein Fur0044_04770 [Anaerolineae bacterium]
MVTQNPDSPTQLSQSLAMIDAVRRMSQRLLETWQESDPVSALEHTLADILRQVGEEVITDQKVSAAVYVYDEDEGFSHGQTRGPLQEYMKQYRPRPGGTGEFTIRTKQPLFVDNVSKMPPDIPRLSQQALDQGVKAFANLPLLIGAKGQETLIGILIINLQEEYEFNQERQALLRLFADQAAIALQNARVHRRRLREQKALQIVSEAAISGNLDEVGQIITREVVILTKSTYATLWSANPALTQLELRAFYTTGPQWYPPQATLPVDEHSVNGYVAITQEAYLLTQPDTDPHYTRWHDQVKSAFCVPLLARQELVGTLYVASAKENGITPAHQDFIKRLAPRAAISLHNARLIELEQHQRQLADTLREVTRLVNSTLESEEVTGLVLDQLGQVIEYDSASVQLIEGDHRKIVGSRGFLAGDSPVELLSNVSQDPLVSRIVQEKQPVVLSDVSDEPLWDVLPQTVHIKSWIGAPLIFGGEVIGLLTIDHKEPGHYTAETGAIVATFANQVAVAIRNAQLFSVAQRRNRDLEVLNESAIKLAQALQADQAFQAVLEAVIETLECDYGTIFLADGDNMLVSRMSAGKLFGEPPQLRFQPGEGLAGWVYQQGQPLLVSNTAADPRYKLGPTEKAVKPRSMILAPLRQGEKIVGVVSADFDRVEAFDENDLRLLNTLALHGGTVLQNIEFFEDFQVLHEAATTLARHASLEQIYQTAVQFATQTLHCKHSTIFMLDKKSGQLVAQARVGLTPQTSADLRRFELGEGLAGHVMATGQPLLVNNTAADARFAEGKVKPLTAPRSMILAPIKKEDEIIGVISADKDEIGGFTEHNLKILETLALDVGIAVENAYLYDLINNQLSRRIKELRAVSDLQQKISSVKPVKEQLQIIYDAAAAAMAELMDTRNMYIALYDEATKTIEFPLAYDKGRRVPDEEKQVAGMPWAARRLDGGKGLTEWMIRHKQPLLVAKDFETWLRTELEIEMLTEGVKCCLGAPLLLGDKVIGVIGLLNAEQEDVYDENQRDLLVTLAGQSAIAINNARQYELLDRRVKELDAVSKFQHRISNVGSVKQELQDIYEAAAEAMSELMDTRNMYIALYDEKAATIEFPLFISEKEVTKEAYAPRRFGERQGLTEWVIRHRQPLLIEKDFDAWVEAQEDIEAFRIGTKCWLGAPMLLRDKVIGVIGLQNFEQEGVFDEHRRDLLMMIASQAAIAIDNAQQYDLINNQLERRKKELEAVSKFQQKISSFSM